MAGGLRIKPTTGPGSDSISFCASRPPPRARRRTSDVRVNFSYYDIEQSGGHEERRGFRSAEGGRRWRHAARPGGRQELHPSPCWRRPSANMMRRSRPSATVKPNSSSTRPSPRPTSATRTSNTKTSPHPPHRAEVSGDCQEYTMSSRRAGGSPGGSPTVRRASVKRKRGMTRDGVSSRHPLLTSSILTPSLTVGLLPLSSRPRRLRGLPRLRRARVDPVGVEPYLRGAAWGRRA